MRLTRRQTGGLGEIGEEDFWKKMWNSSVKEENGKINILPLREGSFFYKLFSTVVKNLKRKIERAQENSKIIVKPFDEKVETEKIKHQVSDPNHVQQFLMDALKVHRDSTESQRKSIEKYKDLIVLYEKRINEYTFNVGDISPRYQELTFSIMECIKKFKDKDFPGTSPDIVFVRRQIYNIIMRFLNAPNGLGLLKASNGNIMITGPPGVGKTLLANSIANIFYKFGILHRKNEELGPDEPVTVIDQKVLELQGSLYGETARKTNTVLYDNLESVVLLDETYSLSGIEFMGPQFCDAIVAFTEPNRGIEFIITAGYPLEMKYRFLSVNIGLDRRFETKIRLYPWGIDSFISGRIIKEYDKPELYVTNSDLKNFIIGTSCLLIGSIYFDVKSFIGCDVPSDIIDENEKNKYFNHYFANIMRKYLPPNDKTKCNYKSNLYPLYEAIMKSPCIENREIMTSYMFKQLGIPSGMILKGQQASLDKLINAISSHPVICPTAVEELEEEPEVDVLEIMNEIFSNTLSIITEGIAGVSINENEDGFQVNIRIPMQTNLETFNEKVKEYVDKLNNPEQANILFSEAVALFNSNNDMAIETINKPRGGNIRDDLRVPANIDIDYLVLKATELITAIDRHNKDKARSQYLIYNEPRSIPIKVKPHNITLKKRH